MATSKRLMLCSGYSDGFYVMEYDESVGTVTQRDQEALSAERANNLAYTVFDERSRSLYAIKELVEPPELSRYSTFNVPYLHARYTHVIMAFQVESR